jgi:hypothetical protein
MFSLILRVSFDAVALHCEFLSVSFVIAPLYQVLQILLDSA